MQVNLAPEDVVIALNKHLNDMGIQTAGQIVTYTFKNRRKNNPGVYATVNIVPDMLGSATPAATPVVTSEVTPVEAVLAAATTVAVAAVTAPLFEEEEPVEETSIAIPENLFE